MKKKTLIFLLIVIGIIAILFTFTKTGLISFDTFSQNNQTATVATQEDQLTNGCYYIWHNPNNEKKSNDLESSPNGIYVLCPKGARNWDDDSFISHTLWFTSSNDEYIPTLYPGDKLIYVSPTGFSYQGFKWEHFADYGYTIGIANMVGDESGHYRIINTDGDGYEGYVYADSDANALNQYINVTNLFLDKIGGVAIRENNISEGGTVLNLTKNNEYVCEWYTGTYFQDFKMKANIHAYGYIEEFTTYKYDFLHSNCIEIVIPEWLTTGYYYINGVGLFRYVTSDDAIIYNGSSFDKGINWNIHIIQYDDYGNMIYNPATGLDKRNEMTELNNNPGTATVNPNYYFSDQNDSEDYYIDDSMGDVGVDEYEYITNEVIIQ